MASASSSGATAECAYLPLDPATGCYVRRSCRQCLETPGCQIGRDGTCEALDASTSDKYDYLTLPAMKDDNASALTINQTWEFPALQVSYCAVDDAVCKRCIADKFWLPEGGYEGDSRFCVGAKGCVCIHSCEYPAETNEAAYCPGPTATPTPSPTPLNCLAAPEDPDTGCIRYRSCNECLDTAGCMISTDGNCELESYDTYPSPEHYDYRLAFKYNTTLPVSNATNVTALDQMQMWLFPANRVQYCPVNDTVCSECTTNNFWVSPGRPLDSRFCVGENGCVCVANCAYYEDYVACAYASGGNDNASYEGWQKFTRLVTYYFIGGMIILCCCCTGILRCCIKRRRAREQVPVALLVTESPVEDGDAVPYTVVVRTTDS